MEYPHIFVNITFEFAIFLYPLDFVLEYQDFAIVNPVHQSV